MHSSARLQAIQPPSAKSVALGALVISVPFVVRLSDMGAAMASANLAAARAAAWFVGLERVLTGAQSPWFATLAAVGVAALVSVALVVAAIYAVLFP